MCLFTISYDPHTVLEAFGGAHNITYSMLSDPESEAIERLGMLNSNVQEQHAFYGIRSNPKYEGVPYPAVFLLDEQGIVVERRFQQSYRVRDTGVGLLARVLDLAAPPAIEADMSTDLINVRAWTGVPYYKPYQQLQLFLSLKMAKGWHVYGEPTPPGFTPLSVIIDPIEGLEVGNGTLPEPQPHRISGLSEEFFVYTNTLTWSLPLIFAFHDQGEVSIGGELQFQLCNDSECLLPGSIEWMLTIPEAPQIGKITISDT